MVKRKFILGSEWGYCKLYTGTKNADMLLVNNILPLMLNLEKEGLIDKWFYIRYIDREFHIRLRFHLTDLINIGTVIKIIYSEFKPLIICRRLSSLVYDTYSRELERYGDKTYEQTETIFYYDSLFLLQIMHKIFNTNAEKSKLRLMIALVCVDEFFDVISLNITNRILFSEQMRNNLREEFGFTNKASTMQFDKKYRYYKSDIEYYLSKESFPDDIEKLLAERKKIMINLFSKLQYTLTIQIENYIASVIHMTMNRLFVSSNKIYEMLVYDFLFRYYNTSIYIAHNEMRSNIIKNDES